MRTTAPHLSRLLVLLACVFLTGCKIEKIDTAATPGDSGQTDGQAATVKSSGGDETKVAYVTNGIREESYEHAARVSGMSDAVRLLLRE